MENRRPKTARLLLKTSLQLLRVHSPPKGQAPADGASFRRQPLATFPVRPEAPLVSELRAIRALKDGIISQDEYDLFIGVKGAGLAVPGTEPGKPPKRALRPEEREKLNRFFRSEESKEWEETDLAL